MKTSIKTIILAAASLFAAMSCQKETAGTQDLVKEGETIQVSINAGLGDFVAADATKATATQVVRLTWETNDKVDAYCGTTKLNTDPITVTPSENGIFAKLSGEIDATSLVSGTSVITFVYSNVNNTASTGEAPTFDFSSQDGTIPFVAYATLVYDGAATLTDKMVEFKFATSVMKIAATNLAGGDINSATIDGINTKVTLTPSESSETCGIAGSVMATITKNDGIEASTDKTRAIFTVGLVPDNNTSRKLTINGRKADLTAAEITYSKSYTTPCAFEEVEFVEIGGKKWATKNLGANTVKDFGKLYSYGNLAGQRGDNDFYPAFTEENYQYTAGYKINDSDHLWNKMDHDAAYNELGGNWRMPTMQDFVDLADACKSGGYSSGSFQPESADTAEGVSAQGVYWCSNYSASDGIKGLLFCDGTNKLFFPAAGFSTGTSRSYGGTYGYYWSSTWRSADYACYLYFISSNVNPQGDSNRCRGRSVRPVSD